MILNLDKILVGLDGQDILDATGNPIMLNKALANSLMNSTKGDAVKYYDWAVRLYKTGTLDLDRSDWDHLKEFIKGLDQVANIYKAQLLENFILT